MLDAWQTVYSDGATKVLEHPRLGSKVVVYRLSYPDRAALGADQLLFERRKGHPPSVVRVQSLSAELNNLPCSQACHLQVTLDHTDYTLKDVATFHEEKGIYVLHQALKGFRFLFSQYEAGFSVTRSMIALNDFEEVKVWFN
jgi:hypothetical protein